MTSKSSFAEKTCMKCGRMTKRQRLDKDNNVVCFWCHRAGMHVIGSFKTSKTNKTSPKSQEENKND